MSPMPEPIRKALREWGAGAGLELNVNTKALFAPLLPGGGGVTQELDIAYGGHARQKLDVYHCADGGSGKTIVLYIPGGGFTGGDKRPDEYFFSNVGRYFAGRGMVCAAANYRLAPEFVWPSGAQDVQGAVRFLKAHAARFGGDPRRVFVFGHSAGAAHAASYLFDPDIRGGDEVIGGALVSGAYAVRAAEMRPNVAQYFGSDESVYARRSALSHVAASKVPVFLALAEFDPLYLAAPSFEMARALTLRDGAAPPILRLEDHNHFSPICAIGTPDERLSAPLTRFIGALAAAGTAGARAE